MTDKELFRVNNFDLIRLLAALEVAIHHALHHFELHDHWLFHSTSWLPGVPIFFFVSGFLISKSYENNSRLSEYARNRALRIYPALIVCTLLSLVSVFATGYFASHAWSLPLMAAWILGQITIVQFYSPEFIRGFGSGALNGSLWTVTVELQFYVLIPIIYWALARTTKGRAGRNRATALLILLLVVPNVVFQQLALDEHRAETMIMRLAHVSFLPWLYMFMLGILAQQNFTWIHSMVRGRALPIVCVYGVIAFVTVHYFGWPTGNEIHPALFPLLAVTVLSLAYTAPTLCDKLLHKNDISYGVYIYHMPIINVMLYYGLVSKFGYAAMAVALTAAIAACSWFIVERPAIRRKKRPLIDLAKAGSAQEART
ncbi:MAG: acyltransferase [Planctomycetes bacterium]|nr:acyltransferase [Planctomycetota bacterium]